MADAECAHGLIFRTRPPEAVVISEGRVVLVDGVPRAVVEVDRPTNQAGPKPPSRTM